MRIPGLWRTKMALRAMRKQWLQARAHRALRRFPLVRTKRPHGLDRPLIITLTSYPPRFTHLGKTLRSLLDQTVAADGVVLWLAHGDVDTLPNDVRELEAHGLEIKACDDLRSYKKLIPALREDPDRYFVTADDDIYYPRDWLAGLVDTASKNPNSVAAWRARVAPITEEDTFVAYRDWPLANEHSAVVDSRHRLFPTGMGGVLYPPYAFDTQITDEHLFKELAPQGDDIWFFWMARLAGTEQKLVKNGCDFLEWPTAQSNALYIGNAVGDGNDRQLAAMSRYFGEVP